MLINKLLAIARRRCALIAAAALFAALALASPCDALSLYQIGNSLTTDSRPSGVADLLRANGAADVENGFHIRGASSLETIWNNPTSSVSSGARHGSFLDALPSYQWDHVAFQPFAAGGSNYADDLRVIGNLVSLAEENPANAGARYYLYSPWSRLSHMDRWEDPVPDLPNPPTAQSRAYYHKLYDELDARMPGRWSMIPAGEVFFEVARRAEAGELPGVATLNDLYRDAIHASNTGRFLAATTVAATVLQQNPSDWPGVAGVLRYGTISQELAFELQSIVWDVLADEPRSRALFAGDFDRDSAIDSADYDLWSQTYGFLAGMPTDLNGDAVVDQLDVDLYLDGADPGAADVNGDGVANAADAALWRDAYGQLSGPADTNADGRVDAADYTQWRDAAERSASIDFDRDGLVGPADFATLQRELGRPVSLFADANQDGRVDAADYTLWRDAVSAATASTAVPQPGGVSIGIAAVFGLLMREFRTGLSRKIH